MTLEPMQWKSMQWKYVPVEDPRHPCTVCGKPSRYHYFPKDLDTPGWTHACEEHKQTTPYDGYATGFERALARKLEEVVAIRDAHRERAVELEKQVIALQDKLVELQNKDEDYEVMRIAVRVLSTVFLRQMVKEWK